MLVVMTFMDVLFLANTVILIPLLNSISYLLCGYVDVTSLLEYVDATYESLFEMQRLDAAGFRRMRTITQMLFETVIQLVLQVRILVYFYNIFGDNAAT